MRITIITHSRKGFETGEKIIKSGIKATLLPLHFPKDYKTLFRENDALIFIGAMGICVRSITPFIKNKKTDPAVLAIDVNGQYVIPVLSGHLGGANALAEDVAQHLGAIPVLTTVSDTTSYWALDMLPKQNDWTLEKNAHLTKITAAFVNGEPTALLLDIKDKGTLWLEATKQQNVTVFYDAKAIRAEKFSVILAVSPFLYEWEESKTLYFRPKVMTLGIGCQKNVDSGLLQKKIADFFIFHKISPLSLAHIGTATLKRDEPALLALAEHHSLPLEHFSSEVLKKYQIPNPSAKVEEVTGAPAVCEAVAMHLTETPPLVEKTKIKGGDKFATFALGMPAENMRKGFVYIVGAGPGNPELITVRGSRLLATADLILYAGSLVPKELLTYAKDGCTVRSSAEMHLEEQISLMKTFYDRGLQIVRLHTGDPCIYGAIQEQMNRMDALGMHYNITPGVSSFQAAAAALKSQFTIPEEVQSIILTRGEGRTPMPEKEQLHRLAKSQSTMCIYLSATIVDNVQKELLMHYPTETPAAVCYKLTWKEEKVFRCTLGTLAQTVKENNLSLTTLLVVGKAIDNRRGESKLYHKNFKHIFRK